MSFDSALGKDIHDLIEEVRAKVASTVNEALTMLYCGSANVSTRKSAKATGLNMVKRSYPH